MVTKRKAFKNFFIILIAAAMLLGPVALPGTALATEGGGGSYPNGAEDFMAGALPPPGTYVKNFLTYYSASEFKNNNGNNLFPDFKLKVAADVVRVIHVTRYKILGADWAFHALIPLVHQDVELTGLSDDRAGLGDIIINPMVLGWHTKNIHVAAGVDIFVPIGSYNQDRLANSGRNYWTFEPVLGVTCLSDNGLELSAKFMYDINTENDDTNYKSGREFHVDYTVGYHINKEWAVGVGGYYYNQMTDDELSGIKVGADGFEGRVFSIGPEVQYGYKNMSFTLKWQPEFEARNKPEGDKLWFNLVYAF
ncbi:MAG TPA: transporter [Smithella sp.]|nr:transporter [Smithella sp.]